MSHTTCSPLLHKLTDAPKSKTVSNRCYVNIEPVSVHDHLLVLCLINMLIFWHDFQYYSKLRYSSDSLVDWHDKPDITNQWHVVVTVVWILDIHYTVLSSSWIQVSWCDLTVFVFTLICRLCNDNVHCFDCFDLFACCSCSLCNSDMYVSI